MQWMSRYPRFSAWIVVLVLVGGGTLGGMLGLRVLQPHVPAHLGHVHGFIVAIKPNGTFEVSVPGYKDPLWFKPAPDAPISLAHLTRHLRERAPTDIYYESLVQNGVSLAWMAD